MAKRTRPVAHRLPSPEERSNLRTGMKKLYRPVSDPEFEGLLRRIKRAEKRR